MKQQRFPRWVPGVATGFGVFVLALVAWFGFVSPQKSKAKSLRAEIETTRQEITARRIASRPTTRVETVRVADVFRLGKAMPTKVDMPGVLLELNRVAGESGISFESITPHAPTIANGVQALPIDVAFQGTFYDLSDFVYRLRNLVRVQRGRLAATGRLFTVESFDFSPRSVADTAGGARAADRRVLDATMTINAYVYTPGGAVAPGTDTTTDRKSTR